MANNEVKKMAPEEYATVDGFDMSEFHEVFDSVFHGTVIEFYVDEDSAVAGCKYKDGTFGIFGAGMDEDGLTEDEMYDGISAGY